MPDIFFVKAQIDPPCRKYPAGRFAAGAYILDGNILTLVHPVEGYPVEDSHGKRYTYALPDNFLPVDVENDAARLTREFRLVLRGRTPSNEQFSRPLEYPKLKY
jgi:hypothetical protein